MYILGVNGWVRGIHDSSAAIFKDGELIAAAEEERFTRRKHSFNTPPHNAILYCLHEAGITADEIDHVAVGWNIRELDEWYGISNSSEELILDTILPVRKFPRKRDLILHLVPHHLSHAAGAYFSSGFNESSIIVIDGSGERESITLAYGSPDGIEIYEQFPLRSSLGLFYSALSVYVGLGMFQEGKTMGLAPYGTPEIYIPDVLDGPPNLRNKDTLRDEEVIGAWVTWLETCSGVRPSQKVWQYDRERARVSSSVPITRHQEMVAASGQAGLERALTTLINRVFELSPSRNICLSGGVALNCVANLNVAMNSSVLDIYIQPPASDAGVSIGAAAYVSWLQGQKPVISEGHVYAGPNFGDEEIAKILRSYNLSYDCPTDLEAQLVDLLASGKVVGRFSGRMEFGPRALGNRSILANPSSRSMHEKVNRIKLREQWRPLAPSVPMEEMTKVMEEPISSPYMLIASTVRHEMRDVLPAVVHVDGSSRAQAVTREFNFEYWRLISNFCAASGIPAVINTSFNIGNEPIVCTPEDAIRSFYGSELDVLAIGSYLIKK